MRPATSLPLLVSTSVVELGAVDDAVEDAAGVETPCRRRGRLAPGCRRRGSGPGSTPATRSGKEQRRVADQQFVSDRRLVLAGTDAELRREADIEVRVEHRRRRRCRTRASPGSRSTSRRGPTSVGRALRRVNVLTIGGGSSTENRPSSWATTPNCRRLSPLAVWRTKPFCQPAVNGAGAGGAWQAGAAPAARASARWRMSATRQQGDGGGEHGAR